MRELNLTEIEAVSGGETVMEPIIVVGRRPEPIMMEHSYGDVWADCQTAVNGGVGTGLCGNTIQAGLASQSGLNEADSGDDGREDENECGYLAEAARFAQAAEDASKRADGNGGVQVDLDLYNASEAADATLRLCVAN
jgi:hypothetical protein